MKEILDAMKIRKLVQGVLEEALTKICPCACISANNPGSPGYGDIPFQARRSWALKEQNTTM